MSIDALRQTPPWEWPADAGETLLAALRDGTRAADEREVAAYLAGDLVVMDDEMAEALISVASDRGEPESVRAAAAISLGPVLEQTFIEGFDDDGLSEPPIVEANLRAILHNLRRIHDDPSERTVVRRRALEAAVRYPEDWHVDAVHAAYGSSEHDWKLTAAFAMQYVKGFEKEILAMVASDDPEVRFEAIRAAGAQEIAAAWPTIELLLKSPDTDRDLLFAAIEAAPGVAPQKSRPILEDLADSDDQEVAEAAREILDEL